MFVQVMKCKVNDADAFRKHGERWSSEVRPGAIGFLGLTAGITSDGTAIAIARFESAAAAAKNAERPEQGAWFAALQQLLSDEPSFAETEDVELLMGGGSDSAGFVQVMRGKGVNRALIGEMDALFEAHAPTWRPDVLGGLRAWTAPADYIEVIYFTSEADARKNEQQPPPPELMARSADFEAMTAGVQYYDITAPIYAS